MVTLIELAIVFLAIFMGVRHGGLALGFWGGLGLIVLAVVFGVFPTAPPIDVMLIILAVCTAASCMEAVGGLDILVRFAAKIIRAKPKMVGVVAPVVSFFLTFFAGTGNAVYALLPVVYEVSYNAGVRPEPAMAGTAVAGQVGITASPIAADRLVCTKRSRRYRIGSDSYDHIPGLFDRCHPRIYHLRILRQRSQE